MATQEEKDDNLILENGQGCICPHCGRVVDLRAYLDDSREKDD